MHWIITGLVGAAIVAGACGAVEADPLYHVTYLGVSISGGAAINNAGEIVGTTSGTDAFTYQNGHLTNLGTLGGLVASPDAVNNNGQFVGQYVTQAGTPTTAFLDSDGTVTTFGALPGYPVSAANGINDSGEIVGSASTRNGSASHAIIYNAGTTTDLGAGGAAAVNSSGEVVGTNASNHAFSYANGTMTDLGTLGGLQSTATAINNLGQIVGYSATSSAEGNYDHAFLYSNGVMQDLGGVGTVPLSFATSINDLGQIVGNTNFSPTGTQRPPFLYSGGTMYNLATLLDSSGAGFTLELVYGINDSGSIVGLGQNAAGYQGVLLTPVPEPGSGCLAAIAGILALAGGFSRCRRRK
jgi:probable HAF family extracellular repeat protein